MKFVTTILPVAFIVVAVRTTDVTAQAAVGGSSSSLPSPSFPQHFQAPSPRIATRSAVDVLPPPPAATRQDTRRPTGFASPSGPNSGGWPTNPGGAPPRAAPSGGIPSAPYSLSQPPNSRLPVAPDASTETVLEAAKIIARVGDQVVLAGDLLGQVNQLIYQKLETLPEDRRAQISDELLDAQRWRLVRRLLPQLIDVKLVYLDFLRTVRKERVPEIQDSLYQQFDEKQLPVMVERAGVQTAADLDRLLRSFGSSLDQQRRSFAEHLVAEEWKRQNASAKKEISHEDLLAYYSEHQAEFRYEAKAKWEQLSTYFDQFPSRRDAELSLMRMGNEVWGGAPLSAVARRSSQGPTAQNGGAYDWTTKGSLRSDVLDKAIFSLPIGKLSRILEDDDGFHIVRVTERRDAGVIPFVDAQATIREKITAQRAEAALQKYVARLRAQTPVSTIFDDESPILP